MKKTTWITLLAVLLILALSTGALAAKGVSILGLATAQMEEGDDPEGDIEEPEEDMEEPEEDLEEPEEEEPEEDMDECDGARALYPELEGRDFGKAISELAHTYPGAVADAIRAMRGEEADEDDDEEEVDEDDGEEEEEEEDGEEEEEDGEFETASVKVRGKSGK